MIAYDCYFEFDGEVCQTRSLWGLEDFLHGFWIDEGRHFTKGADCHYFIPVGMILYIEKVDVEEKGISENGPKKRAVFGDTEEDDNDTENF